jgi:hypothetical protein
MPSSSRPPSRQFDQPGLPGDHDGLAAVRPLAGTRSQAGAQSEINLNWFVALCIRGSWRKLVEVSMKLPHRKALGIARCHCAAGHLAHCARRSGADSRRLGGAGRSFPSIWLFKKDLARHFGKSYVLEPVHFAGTPPMVTAITNNEVQIGELA